MKAPDKIIIDLSYEKNNATALISFGEKRQRKLLYDIEAEFYPASNDFKHVILTRQRNIHFIK